MTPDEYATWIDWMEDAWPGTRMYAKADQLYPDFAPFAAAHLETACRSLFAKGTQTAPSMSTIWTATIEQVRLAPTSDRMPYVDYCSKEGHVWAIVDMEDRSDDGLRHAICARCGRDTMGDQESLPTVGERKARHAAR